MRWSSILSLHSIFSSNLIITLSFLSNCPVKWYICSWSWTTRYLMILVYWCRNIISFIWKLIFNLFHFDKKGHLIATFVFISLSINSDTSLKTSSVPHILLPLFKVCIEATFGISRSAPAVSIVWSDDV